MEQMIRRAEGGKQYLELPVWSGEALPMACQQTKNGLEIAEFLFPTETTAQGMRYAAYDITGLVSLREYLMNGPGQKNLANLFVQLCQSFSKRGLPCCPTEVRKASLPLELDTVFVEPISGSPRFCLLPCHNEEQGTELSSFFRECLFNARISDRDEIELVTRMLTLLNRPAPLLATEVLRLLWQSEAAQPPREERAAPIKSASKQPVAASIPLPPPPIKPMNPPITPIAPLPTMPPVYGGTSVLGVGDGIGSTVITGGTVYPAQTDLGASLLRLKTGERITVNKPVFRIGKEKSYVDYFISDNPAISRSHADIIRRDGCYFLRDNGSTNHSYINSAIIAANIDYSLHGGDYLMLANETFEFIID